jgi:serine phosphatase RsbU (regulator of sigma subunit)
VIENAQQNQSDMFVISSSADFQRASRIASSLQHVLLRTHPRAKLERISFEVFYEAALQEATVGGDSYDVIPLIGGKVAFVVADASGKGLDAAERIAEIKFALRAFLREHSDPCIAIARLNDFAVDAEQFRSGSGAVFTTLSMVILDSATGELCCICAGGEPPLILRSSGQVESIQVGGAALGFCSSISYASVSIQLGLDESVLLVTDGITEARQIDPSSSFPIRNGPCLGLHGVAGLAAKAAASCIHLVKEPLNWLGQCVFEGARAFSSGCFHDDSCLLLVRREPK